MYYCENCRKEKNWPKSLVRSLGKCEICDDDALCYDMPSSRLPMGKNDSEIQYYKEELQKIDTQCIYGVRLKIVDGHNNDTKWLDLNPKSIEKITEWFKNFK